MNHLLEVRKNIFYHKNKKGEFIKAHEIILIIDEPKYTQSNEGDIIRERGCKELRFTLGSDKVFDAFIELLKGYKEVKEEDLK